MLYRIVAQLDDHTPASCTKFNGLVIYGTSDVRCPPHALTEAEYQDGVRCQCVLVEHVEPEEHAESEEA